MTKEPITPEEAESRKQVMDELVKLGQEMGGYDKRKERCAICEGWVHQLKRGDTYPVCLKLYMEG